MRSILLLTILLMSLCVHAQHKDLSKLFVKGKFEQVIEKGMPKLLESPADAVLNMLVGRANIALRNYETAIPFLEKSYNDKLAHPSVKSWSLAELGTAQYHTGQIKLGVENLEKAMEMKATRSCSRFAHKQLMRFQENIFFKKWNVHETEHLRFHFQDETVIGDIEVYMADHQKSYEDSNRFFKAELSKKIDLFVWKDKEEAYDLFERRLGFANSDRKIINVWYKKTNGYEICQVLCDIAIKPKKKTKLINEGICVYFDRSIRNKMDVARKAMPNGKFYFLELWESPTRYERGLSYPIGGAFIDFLINKEGKAKLMKFLKDQSIENAEEVYPDFKDLVKTFEAMLHVQL